MPGLKSVTPPPLRGLTMPGGGGEQAVQGRVPRHVAVTNLSRRAQDRSILKTGFPGSGNAPQYVQGSGMAVAARLQGVPLAACPVVEHADQRPPRGPRRAGRTEPAAPQRPTAKPPLSNSTFVRRWKSASGAEAGVPRGARGRGARPLQPPSEEAPS